MRSNPLSFARERVRRPYKANRAQARGAGRVGSQEAVTARSPNVVNFQTTRGTNFATWGVRVDQVGVNPSGERSFDGGLPTHLAQRAPWPVNTRLVVARKGDHHSKRGGLPPQHATRPGRFGGVLVDLPSAEVGRRHVA